MAKEIQAGKAIVAHLPSISLRDYFAGLALQGLLVRDQSDIQSDIADEAYEIADAMLEAKAKC